MLRPRRLLVAVLALAACAGKTPAPAGPSGQARLGEQEYAAARSEYDALPLSASDRASRRATLENYLLRETSELIGRGHADEAYEVWKQALTLYDAEELSGKLDDKALLSSAQSIEQQFRRRGAHEQVYAALAVQLTLAPKDQAARSRWEQLSSWLRTSAGDKSDSDESLVDGKQRMSEDLESVAHVWPAPIVVDELSKIYVERVRSGEVALPRRDQQRMMQGRMAAPPNPAIDLTRLYLRVSRPQDGVKQLAGLEGQPGDDSQARQLLEKLASDKAQPQDAIAIAMFLSQQGRDDRDVAARVCRDAARRFPSAVEPRLCAGQLALSLDQLVVALRAFEEAIKIDPSRREPWEALAKVYQTRLFQLVTDENLDIAQLDAQLKKVENFHTEAQKRFGDKPIRPSMAAALFEVGRGYYNAGRPLDAMKYLERSIAVEASPPAYELLGQIRLKKGNAKEAAQLFEQATGTQKGERAEQLYWRAKLRRQLADAQEAAGDPPAATATRKGAIADWEVLVGLGLTPEFAAEAGIEKAKLLYQLGEREPAIASFNRAIDVAPDRGSTYADVIAFLVPRGELDEALDAYHRALGRNEVTDYLKLYCSLWVIDLARRAKQPEDPLATAYLRSADGGKWFDDLARWASGRSTDADIVKRASTVGRKAELTFYRSMRALSEGKEDEAKQLWKEVIATDMMAFFEYDMAAFFLKLGSAPAAPLIKPSPPAPGKPPAKKTRTPPSGSI